jgi:Spy/CpxP family protein refolding chaperone
MKRTLIASAVFAAVALAQPPMGPGQGPGQGFGPAQTATPNITDIKAYLTLTDTQITGIQAVQKQLQTAVQNLQTQIQTKQTALDTAMAGANPDALTVGKLLVDIANLHKQVQTQAGTFRDQAINLLTAAQKTKLTALNEAAKLQPAIHQAIGLLLLAPPVNPYGTPGIGGGPRGGRGFGSMPSGGGYGPRAFALQPEN